MPMLDDLSNRPYVRFYDITNLNNAKKGCPLEFFDFVPTKAKLLLQRGIPSDDRLQHMDGEGDAESIYVSGQDDYLKTFDRKVVSRRHATVRWLPSGSRPLLRDEGSTHGTFYSHLDKNMNLISVPKAAKEISQWKKLTAHESIPLCDGDVIQLGRAIEREEANYAPLRLFVEVYSPYENSTGRYERNEAVEHLEVHDLSDDHADDDVIEVPAWQESKYATVAIPAKSCKPHEASVSMTELVQPWMEEDESDVDFVIGDEGSEDASDEDINDIDDRFEEDATPSSDDTCDECKDRLDIVAEDMFEELAATRGALDVAANGRDASELAPFSCLFVQPTANPKPTRRVGEAESERLGSGTEMLEEDTQEADINNEEIPRTSMIVTESVIEIDSSVSEEHIEGEAEGKKDFKGSSYMRVQEITDILDGEKKADVTEQTLSTPSKDSTTSSSLTPVSKIAGSKRDREEDEEEEEEEGGVAAIDPTLSCQSNSTVPIQLPSMRSYKKAKTFAAGVATGLVAGMVATFVGLSSLALSETPLI